VLVIKILITDYIVTVENRVCNCGCVQHCLEALDVRIDSFIVYRKVGCELVDEHSRSQGVVSRCAVDLLYLIFDPIIFLTDRS
jgi:hypothetical protein